MKRKNARLAGTMIAFGAATLAGAYTAYKLRKAAKENIINNFNSYVEDGCCNDEGKAFLERKGKFSFKDVFSRKEENSLGNKVHPYENTMKFRKDRVYKKGVKGINATKYTL
ncbi:hypothetical protein [Desnuesiella massiliensis]|uniref:hypothetical protein n=1 Tax=Desnuesiella massiliensis TaxID=1650662 RepID=UPI0006E332A4|nr:hypothetical protein [Desnuesiella massiliensis]